jgi:hypothetical protein
MKVSAFRDMALSFPGTIEAPHFERVAFKVVNKRIFATLHEETGMANMKFSPKEQLVFCAYDRKVIYPVPNKWGLQGWTTFDLKKIPQEFVMEGLDSAHREAIKSKSKRNNK